MGDKLQINERHLGKDWAASERQAGDKWAGVARAMFCNTQIRTTPLNTVLQPEHRFISDAYEKHNKPSISIFGAFAT